MKKNPLGGYIVEGLHASAKREPIHLDDRAKVYGPSTQCPNGSCGHGLTEAHFKTKLAKRERKTLKGRKSA